MAEENFIKKSGKLNVINSSNEEASCCNHDYGSQALLQINNKIGENIIERDSEKVFQINENAKNETAKDKLKKRKILFLRASTGWKDPSPPLAFSYLGAIAKQEGFEVFVENLNAIYNKTTVEEVIELIKREQPIVGINVYTNYVLETYELIKKIRKYCKTIIAGGPHVTGYAEEVLEKGDADIAMYGEAEFSFAEVINAIYYEKDLHQVPGIVFKERDKETGKIKFVRTKASQSYDLDKLPFPDRSVHRKENYIKVKEDINNFGGILTSRGCPGKCTFCYQSMFGHDFRYRSPENIFKEIKHLYEDYGITHINFIDDVFTINKTRLMNLCDILIKEKLPIEWVCATRIDSLSKDMIDKMGEAGCVMISFGVESCIPETLLKIKKTTNPSWYTKQVENLLKWCNDAGIRVGVNILTGYPWDNANNIRIMQEYVKKISPYVTQNFCGGVLQPMPDTEIYYDYVKDYDFKDWWLYEGDKKPIFDEDYHPFFMLHYHPFWEQLNNNWFNLDKEVFNEIDKLYKIMGKWNMWMTVKRRFKNPIKRYFIYRSLYGMSKLSLFLFKVSPKLEELMAKPLMEINYKFKHKK